ncbi:hypothetical protein HJG60_008687 [Phyllostomus discolor]|uniref:Uncharacterized protein n=1 Tax=Phyllostomus discolor TaxID=89673 RepID=A0A833Z3W9_9CHIR|nr:hypothetical protein HJG60_008687 [Phyllostomus discolor]
MARFGWCRLGRSVTEGQCVPMCLLAGWVTARRPTTGEVDPDGGSKEASATSPSCEAAFILGGRLGSRGRHHSPGFPPAVSASRDTPWPTCPGAHFRVHQLCSVLVTDGVRNGFSDLPLVTDGVGSVFSSLHCFSSPRVGRDAPSPVPRDSLVTSFLHRRWGVAGGIPPGWVRHHLGASLPYGASRASRSHGVSCQGLLSAQPPRPSLRGVRPGFLFPSVGAT